MGELVLRDAVLEKIIDGHAFLVQEQSIAVDNARNFGHEEDKKNAHFYSRLSCFYFALRRCFQELPLEAGPEQITGAIKGLPEELDEKMIFAYTTGIDALAAAVRQGSQAVQQLSFAELFPTPYKLP